VKKKFPTLLSRHIAVGKNLGKLVCKIKNHSLFFYNHFIPFNT